MRIAYVEPFSGASGDMILGALFDAGLAHGSLIDELQKLGIPDIAISVNPRSQHGIGGSHAIVKPEDGHHARSWRDIRELIQASGIAAGDKQLALDVFTRLAEAESIVHGESVDDVHFHEVGALDTIVDIVGCVVGLRLLGVERVFSAPVHVGGGTVMSAHGILPVPAPATALLLARLQVPVAAPLEGEEVAGELLTPTGAALLGTLATFSRPAFTPDVVGVGFGSKSFPWANMLRITTGYMADSKASDSSEQLLTLETNIDDMNPQFYELLNERLFQAGALDVWSSAIQMKKGRAAQRLSVLCSETNQQQLISLLIEQSTTLGVRVSTVERYAADRRIETTATKWGNVRIKLKIWNGRVLDISPEYDDCLAIAREHDVAIRDVWNEAHRLGEVYIGRRAETGGQLARVDPLG